MTALISTNPWERLCELANRHDTAGLESYLASLEPSETLRAILRLDPDERELILTLLSPAEAAALIGTLPGEQAVDFIETLAPADAASIVTEMVSDEQADLLADLETKNAEAILAEMAPAEAKEARQLSRYADDVAGGLMVTEFFRFTENTTAGDALDDLAKRSDDIAHFFARYIYVVSPWDRLVGVLEVRDLALAPRHSPLAEVMVPALFLTPEAPLDELKSFFDSRSFVAVPIVNNHGRLLGIVRRTSVTEALADRAEREMMRMQGIIGGDEIRTLPVLTRSRRRLAWLSINIVLNIAAASVIALYIDTLEAVIALAVFLPIISDMSGCTGNQAVAVSMRELSLGIVKPFEAFRVWLREISVGVINGVALGILLGLVAWGWKGNPYLGLVVGGAMTLNTLIAVSIGGVVPLLLKRIKVDPAVASGPILTTVTDMCGFFLVLSLAAIMLSKLT